MKAKVLSIKNEPIKEIDLPNWFSDKIREDIGQKYFEASKRIQPHTTDILAGMKYSASGKLRHMRHKWKTTYGHGISRVPRKILWRRGDQFYWIGATVSGTRGGRRAHPPKVEHFLKEKKINKKYVYNLTLSDIHCYFANQILIKNCGCFECIVAIIPESNGFMIVHRGYSGMTPCGMSFTTLAGSVGGGVQTPGFLGIGRLYILSKKFISADGGLARIVWMSKELKESLGERLKQRCQEIGLPDLFDKIADETQATSLEELLNFLAKVGHPALNMPPLV